MDKMEALKYLIENSVYCDEWTGAGMYVELKEIIESDKEEYTEKELDKALERANDF